MRAKAFLYKLLRFTPLQAHAYSSCLVDCKKRYNETNMNSSKSASDTSDNAFFLAFISSLVSFRICIYVATVIL